MARRRGFGHIRKLPSGRWQASYIGPDGARHAAGVTFDARIDAEGWLVRRRDEIEDGSWTLGGTRRPRSTTLGDYAASWLERRDLKPRTRDHYRHLLDSFILPTFGTSPLRAVTPREVNEWHHQLGKVTGPTYRAHAYSLLRTLYRTAIDEDEATTSPCRLRGGGQSKRVKKIQPASLEELQRLTEAMPDRLRAAVLIAAWCGLRFGELTELRRKDVDLRNGILHIRRGVVLVDGERLVGTPKSGAGVRDVAVPPHLLPVLRDHIAAHVDFGRDALIFTSTEGAYLPHSSLSWHWNRAREAAGRPDLRWHDLRHTGAVLAAQTGASLAELMARLGHSSVGAALRYQHAARGRDGEIAAALSALASRGRS